MLVFAIRLGSSAFVASPVLIAAGECGDQYNRIVAADHRGHNVVVQIVAQVVAQLWRKLWRKLWRELRRELRGMRPRAWQMPAFGSAARLQRRILRLATRRAAPGANSRLHCAT